MAGLGVLLTVTVLLTHPYSYTMQSWYEYKALERDSLDVIMVGNSHMYTSAAPMQLWRDYGIASWDIGASAMNTPAKLAYIEEALKTQTPQVLALEAYSVDQLSVVGRKENDWAYDNMPYSPTKVASVLRTVAPSQWEQYIVPLTRYHANYSDLKPGMLAYVLGMLHDPSTGGASAVVEAPAAGGDVAASGVVQGVNVDSKGTETGHVSLAETTSSHGSTRAVVSVGYIKQIAALCKERGITFVVYLAPVRDGYKGAENPLPWIENQLKDEYPDTIYLNLNDRIADIGLTESDFRDSGHVFAWGMTKVTRYLYENLLRDLVVPSGDSNPNRAWWDAQAKQWDPPASSADVEETP